MKTIRRIYLYLVSAISIELVLWGSIQLLRSILQPDITGVNTQNLSTGIAQVLVSIPIFLIHWFIIQSDVRKSDEERDSILRPIFLYGISLGTLIPVVQNVLALINRLFLVTSGGSRLTALVGQSQTSIDNGIAILLNLVLAWYFWRILLSEETSSHQHANYVSVLRVYRYIWMLYSLGMTVLGVDQLILFVFTNTNPLAMDPIASLINPLALLVIGTPIWVFASIRIQQTLGHTSEQNSPWRVGILYGLIFIGSLMTLFAWINILGWAYRMVINPNMQLAGLFQNIRSSIAIIVPSIMVWVYYHRQFEENLDRRQDAFAILSYRRIFHYPLALVGLVCTVSGLIGFLQYLIDMLASPSMFLSGSTDPLATNGAILSVGAIYWVRFFFAENSISMQSDEHGVEARRSLIRKIYLYGVVFGAIVGVMASAGITLFQVFEGSLNGQLASKLTSIYKGLVQLVVFGVILWYHLTNLRRDSQLKASVVAEKQTGYKVMVAEDALSILGKAIQTTFTRQIPLLPIEFCTDPTQWKDQNAYNALVISAQKRMDPKTGWGEATQNFSGKIIILCRC